MAPSPTLKAMITRKFLRASLIPILCIEALLLILYFSVNAYISKETSQTLTNSTQNTLIPLAQQSADQIDAQLKSISFATAIAQSETQRWHQSPQAFPQPLNPPEFATWTNKTFYKKNQSGCGLFYAGNMEMTPERRQKALLSEALDPIYSTILKNNQNLAAVYYNTNDNMNRLCPFIPDLWSQYPADLKMSDYNFYYLADLKHNPNKNIVWTSVYLDPAGQGWMASAIAPVYYKDRLEGVVGLDVTVDKISSTILKQQLPWNASLFLVDSSGLILAMSQEAEKALGLQELKGPTNQKGITQTIHKPEDFNLFKNPNQSIAKIFKDGITQNKMLWEFESNGFTYLISQAVIPETKWRLMALVNKNNVLEPIQELKSLTNFLGFLVLGALILFYIFFFSLLYLQSKQFANKISNPIARLAQIAAQMGSETKPEFNNIRITDENIQEIEMLNTEFLRMQKEIQERTESLIKAQVARQMQIKETELAYKVGLFESTASYLHNIGNSLAGMQGQISQLHRIEQSTQQWPEAYAQIFAELRKIPNIDATQTLQWLEKLRKVQIEGAAQELKKTLHKLTDNHESMAQAIHFQQEMLKEQDRQDALNFLQNFDLAELTQDCLTELDSRIHDLGIQIHFAPQSLELYTQKFQISFGITNLIKNAIEALENQRPATPQIEIEILPDPIGARFLIRDNGCGIDQEELQKIFLSGHTTKKSGHGYGLPSFILFLESRGGSLRAHSPGLGLGSTFEAWIPNES
jgi:signal transduction histidine kinase